MVDLKGNRTCRGLAIIASFLIVAVCGESHFVAAQKKSSAVVVIAEVVGGRIVYKVNSKPAIPDILRALSVARERQGDSEAIALVDSEAPISEMGNIEGIADKAGFSRVQFYVFDKVARKMSTIQFGPDIPYSENPPAE